jgi:hypothetical protein
MPRRPALLTSVFVGYHGNAINKPLLSNGRLPNITHVGGSHKLVGVSNIRPLPLPSTSLLTHYSVNYPAIIQGRSCCSSYRHVCVLVEGNACCRSRFEPFISGIRVGALASADEIFIIIIIIIIIVVVVIPVSGHGGL